MSALAVYALGMLVVGGGVAARLHERYPTEEHKDSNALAAMLSSLIWPAMACIWALCFVSAVVAYGVRATGAAGAKKNDSP